MRVAIVEERTLLRQGLAAILSGEAELNVVGEAADLETACRLCHREEPDIVLLDAALLYGPDGDDPHVIARLRAWSQGGLTLIIGRAEEMRGELRERQAALQAGALDYLSLHTERDDLLKTVKAAREWEGGIQRKAVTISEETERHLTITPREKEILALIVRGLSNKEIAAQLGIHLQTVKNHISHLLEKFAFADRTQLAVYFSIHPDLLK